MNKQQLANKIWESANKMRSKIEANEYKDYILGFIFYKFLSDKEVDFLKKDGYEEADLQEHVHENNEELVDYCQQHLGYFIAYDNLFSTWLDKGNSFTVDNVRTALSAFNRLISDTQKKVFSKIFNNAISMSAIIGGFLFTGISILISVIDKERIERLWNNSYLDNLYRSAFVGMIANIITIIVAFSLVFLDIPSKAEDTFVEIEIAALIIGVVFFAWCIKYLLFIISKLKTEK